VARLNGSGNVAILEGVLGSEVANARKTGFMSALRAAPGIKLVASQTANYEREQGLNVFRNILQSHPDLDALFAANDEMALGAVQAIQEMGYKRKVVIVGFDAIPEALKAIDEGKMAGTIEQQPAEMGKAAIETTLAILDGKPVAKEIMIPVRLVTKESLHE
jgi:ribose transport system substrate-binding protein